MTVQTGAGERRVVAWDADGYPVAFSDYQHRLVRVEDGTTLGFVTDDDSHGKHHLIAAAEDFASRLCEHMASEGYSVLLLGGVGTGKSTVAKMVPGDLAHRVVAWNEGGGSTPPPTDKVAYVLLSRPIGVSLHYRLPPHADGLEAMVRRCVDPGWLR